jgi:peptidoglycan-N-acetylglucosamine deacetylase
MLLPMAIAHARKRRRLQLAPSSWQPSVSILVPAYNEARVIGKSLEALLQSHYSKYEVIVIDDGSTDRTAQVVQEYSSDPRIRLVVREHEGKSRALNAGIQEARGEIVVTTDADTLLDPDFIPRVLTEFEDSRVAAVSGNIKVGNRHFLLAGWQSIEYITAYNLDRRAYALLNCISVLPGAASAWRRQELLAVGGFAHDTLAEDADLTVRLRRLGLRVGYADRALAWTESPQSVRNFLKQRRRWSYGTLQVLWKHRDVLFRPKYGALGFVAFPSALIYLGLVLLAPLMEGSILWALLQYGTSLIWDRSEMPPLLDSTFGPIIFCLLLIGVEWSLSLIGFLLDGESRRPLIWVPIQRLAMRWLLYCVMLLSMLEAIRGLHVNWSKVERTGTVPTAGDATTLSEASGRSGATAALDSAV